MSAIAIAAVPPAVVLHAGIFVLEAVVWARPNGLLLFAGLVGGFTVNKGILLLQSMPAAMAAAVTLI